ncbi:hypothetical protein L6164_001053 [Bauhinia variegata]|uniref:Uncharacterized protein n=1 Tax=Bauhinia variegata TaxID=167791 RepID=A0ACB9Q8C6_BAUVA|nr:hypothetical protein L6164_001053 [Bauhinia variegata]
MTRCNMMESNPPLLQHYGALLLNSAEGPKIKGSKDQTEPLMDDCELPLIDLSGLSSSNERERLACSSAICRASSEWGFFQVVNHGINPDLLRKIRREQVKLFELPFEKVTCGLLNNSYRWGTQTATRPKQFSWSEAFHIPLNKISEAACWGEFTSLSGYREVIQEFAAATLKLSWLLAGILAENLGYPQNAFEEICDASTYQVGGLQLMKDSKWVTVKPNPDALIVNIGDLFQAWSNDVYRSVQHKVMANDKMDRYSTAYFLCPSYDTLIGSGKEPSMYRKFTFGEYRSQIQEDVKEIGHKIGLPRFIREDTDIH